MAVTVGLHRHLETFAVAQVTFDPVTPGANTVSEQMFLLEGVRVGDLVWVFKPTVTPDVAVGQARVSALSTVTNSALKGEACRSWHDRGCSTSL